jgi:hypothetical protein
MQQKWQFNTLKGFVNKNMRDPTAHNKSSQPTPQSGAAAFKRYNS